MPSRSLRQTLDDDILTVVDRLINDQQIPRDVRSVYQAIQRSNSSLSRRPRRVLEESIERVLGAMADDDVDPDTAMELEHETANPQSANIMNQHITSSWNLPTAARAEVQRPNSSQTNGTNGESQRKRKRLPEPKDRSPPTDVSFDDLGGIDHVIAQLEDLVFLPIVGPSLYTDLSTKPPRGVLLHGPPGCGKSMLARACAAELGVPFIELLGPSIVSSMSGESEKQVREVFEEARRIAPCLLFIDEIDVIAPKRETSQSQMEKRIVAQLLISMDSLSSADGDDSRPVMVLAATNRPDSIDPALRRGGRFDTEINMGVPNQATRERILRAQTRKTPLSEDVDFEVLANKTPGFVGADLRDLVSRAAVYKLKQYKEQYLCAQTDLPEGLLSTNPVVASIRHLARQRQSPDFLSNLPAITVDMSAFLAILPSIVPSSKREGFATIPDVSWNDIGALASVRETLRMHIVEHIKKPDLFASVGISKPSGILLYGPPGCGKTLLAKAVAAESKANFISVKGPELLEKYVGESERALRTLFMRARSSVPCVVFFDELDALVPRRDSQHSEASTRVVNTLLAELDGLSERTGIYVVGATNRPEMIDEAVIRPGRFERSIHVGLPGANERGQIMAALCRDTRIIWPAGLCELAQSERCAGFSGADLEGLKREAGRHTLQRDSAVMTIEDFEAAVEEIQPSVGDTTRYDAYRDRRSIR